MLLCKSIYFLHLNYCLHLVYIEPKMDLPLETTTLTMMMIKMNKTTRVVMQRNLQTIVVMESLEV